YHWNAPAEDHNLSRVGFLNAEQRRAWLRLVEYPRLPRLADGQIDTSDHGATLAHERKEVAPGIEDLALVCHSHARRCSFACLQHSVCVIQRQSCARPWHVFLAATEVWRNHGSEQREIRNVVCAKMRSGRAASRPT